jgi:hypothetical protein
MKPTFFKSQSDFRKWLEEHQKEETRLKRLVKLIEDSANRQTITPLTRKKKSQ